MFTKFFYLLALASFIVPSLAYSELHTRDVHLTRRKVAAVESYCNIFPEGDICDNKAHASRPSVSERTFDEVSGAVMKRLDGLIASNCASLPDHLKNALAAKGHCRSGQAASQGTLPATSESIAS